MRKPTNLPKKLLWLGLLLGILLLWQLLDPGCIFRRLTGFICPGCGMSRAWLAALRLNFTQAFYYHPLFWSIPFLVLFGLYDFSLFRKEWCNLLLVILFAAALLGTYIVRLIAFLNGNLTI